MIRRSEAWPGYIAIATVGYVLYSLGAVGPYLRERLDLTEVQVGLHPSALAVGFIVAGLFAPRLSARTGEVAVRGGALVLLALGIAVIAWAPSAAATLSAALAIGLGSGTVLGYTNASLSEAGGSLARLRLGRANVWAMAAAFFASLLLAVGAGGGIGWWIWLAPGLSLVAIDAFDLRSGARLPADDGEADGRLPNAFWLTWLYIVAVVAVEGCIVFWGATLVERRSDVSTQGATAAAALFFAGMFAGRVGLGAGIGTSGDVRRPIGVGLVLAILGSITVWLSTVPLLSAVALFGTGIGISVLYPLGVSAALATAPGQLAHAGARLTLASGIAILLAPLALGGLADLTGVVIGWSLVVILAVAALALSRLLMPTVAVVETADA